MDTNLLNINKWTSKSLDLNSICFPPNLSFSYDNTLNSIDLDEKYCLNDNIHSMRKSAECHRQVRRFIQPLLKPGVKYLDICKKLEEKTVELMGRNDLKQGVGFYTSWSVNEVAAHDSAIPNDTRVLKYDDVLKLDFGTHVNGYITDCAFTVAFNPVYKPLLDSTKEATWNAIKMAGPGVRMNDISKEINEIIESYEMEKDGKTYQIKSIGNLGGHNIKQFQIHGGDIILCKPSTLEYYKDLKMKEDTCYAIETFATTGSGRVVDDTNSHCSHFMKKINHSKIPFQFKTTKKLYKHITNNRGTLPFCTRWLNETFNENYKIGLNELLKKNILNSYPPLIDPAGGYSSQLEHTIYLHKSGKEILSYGEDY